MAPAREEEGSRAAEEKESEKYVEEEAGGDDEDDAQEDAPSHLPLAPRSEILDISTTVDPSYIISLIRRLLPHNLREGTQSQVTENSATSVMGCEMKQELRNEERSDDLDDRQSLTEDAKDPWEDCGCVLWDLAASKSNAELMVNNLILEVLLANLHVTDSFRVMEICLGIIGNLACHENLSNAIISTNGLVETIVDQLFRDDSACLSEAFRLLAVSLRTSNFISFTEALLPDQILSRILWIIGNTLNSTLLEKSIDFLLAIIYNQDVREILLQPLVKLGLPNLIVSLLASETNKSMEVNQPERFFIVDLTLRLVEALSTADNYSDVISSNGDLFRLVCEVVKLPDKFEVASLCVSAVVIIANTLADEQHLILGILNDFQFLQGLFDVLPFVSDDSQARNAFWCILARLLHQVDENVSSTSNLHQFVLLLLHKSFLIEEDIDSHLVDNPGDNSSSCDVEGKSYAVTTCLKRIACILEKWNKEGAAYLEKDDSWDENHGGKARKLLSYCLKYSS
ncbi:hypothetical protein OPV22_021013 [Ensete ventricosum]|uniref:Protein saal1 n=1 Tax=Ensete ventricosum TaxID=4639 RepID=A0AAV8PCJ5_ENSVE|nr:hypothetical protein OPV22_021013 [Ensete ventricosum]